MLRHYWTSPDGDLSIPARLLKKKKKAFNKCKFNYVEKMVHLYYIAKLFVFFMTDNYFTPLLSEWFLRVNELVDIQEEGNSKFNNDNWNE